MPKPISLGSNIVTQPDEVAEIFDRMRTLGIALPALCTENSWTTYAAVSAADELAAELGVTSIPVMISTTGHYQIRSQLLQYLPQCTSTHPDPTLSALDSFIWDLEVAVSQASHNVQGITHLDHGAPDRDQTLIEYGLENRWWGTIMYDCSPLPLAENIQRTAAFVKQTAGRALVEGIVDQLYDAGTGHIQDHLTQVSDALRFWEEVQPYLMVANLGTEHRATQEDYQPQYHGEVAQAITQALGSQVLVLHGTSCLRDADLPDLARDGIIQVNVWTKLERDGAAALAAYVTEHLPELTTHQDLDYFPINRWREVWVAAVKATVKHYILAFGYERLANRQEV